MSAHGVGVGSAVRYMVEGSAYPAQVTCLLGTGQDFVDLVFFKPDDSRPHKSPLPKAYYAHGIPYGGGGSASECGFTKYWEWP